MLAAHIAFTALTLSLQPSTPPSPPPTRLEDLPPSLRLGLRATILRAQLPVIPTLVIVPDSASFAAAVSAWSLKPESTIRFPILIDDNSFAAHEAIARFVRSFQPKDVVRWAAPADHPKWPDAADRAARADRISAALYAAWDVDSTEALHARWAELKHTPPGIVVADPADPTWTAALALAASRGQPLAFTTPPTGNTDPNSWLQITDADQLSRDVTAALDQLPWKWSDLGDDIDALTLCLNCPTKAFIIEGDPKSVFALSDLLGRHAYTPSPREGAGGRESSSSAIPAPASTSPEQSDGSKPKPPSVVSIPGPSRTSRWAFCGHIFGSESSAAYDAMCALFLTPRSAWLFDGYDNSEPWNNWDATAAATFLERAGITTTVNDNGAQSAADFRKRATDLGPPKSVPPGDRPTISRALSADLITVNTSGNAEFFDLKPGQCLTGDLPYLQRPAAVHFVHSWSAQLPADRKTIAARWRERGVFAYIGSVYEPYLQAFVPTPQFTARFAAGFPWGAAGRLDNAQPWKIAVFGDPLYTLAQPSPISDSALPLAGAISLKEQLAPALRAKDFKGSLELLHLLARDADAADLLAAIIRDDPKSLTTEAALAGLHSAFFAAELPTFTRVYAAAATRIETRTDLAPARDMPWHALYPVWNTMRPEEADLLERILRPDQLVRDCQEAMRAAAAARPNSASGVAGSIRARALRLAPTEDVRRALPPPP